MNKKLETKDIDAKEVIDLVAEESVEIDEASKAADTLKPNSQPAADPKSRVEIMKTMIGAMAEMPKKDLVKWFDQTQALYHKGKDWGVGDKSASNQASVDMKGGKGPKTKDPMPTLNVKEDVEAMFSGQDLSEEFKDKASTLFEAAVSARLTVEMARLEEEFEEKLATEVASIEEQLATKLDSYLDYVVETWLKDNEVAIESTLRNEIMEEFIGSLKNVFEEHYIDVPAEKTDVLESLAARVQELEEKLDEVINENTELKSSVVDHEMNDVFESLCSDLALTQVEKFRALSEGIKFDGDLDTYEKKLSIIKENYFKSTEKAPTQTVVTEELEESDATTDVVYTDPRVKSYVQAISRTIKK
jgi:hypothetical protein